MKKNRQTETERRTCRHRQREAWRDRSKVRRGLRPGGEEDEVEEIGK